MSDWRVIVSGGSGLIGQELMRALRADGARVVQLVRRRAQTADEVEWLTDGTPLDPGVLEGATAVVNLNGASIGRLPWTGRYREALRESRLAPTRTLATAIRALGENAPTFVSASAMGFYGDRPGEELTESSGSGETFLAKLCVGWEEAALASGPRARVVLLRTAPILHPRGVLKPMIALTRFGLGGPLGGGEQIWPWMSLDDEVRAIRHLIDAEISGPVNLCGPVQASENAIGRALARSLRRPYALPAPAWALRLGLGRDAADSLLLADAAATPRVLLESGFEFQHETAERAIAASL